MELIEDVTEYGSHVCNKCKVEIGDDAQFNPEAYTFYRCKVCDYDFCKRCSNNKLVEARREAIKAVKERSNT